MALRKKGRYYYGDNQEDLALELKRYSELNKYPIDEVKNIICEKCGQQSFKLFSDDDESAALCQCINCAEKIYIRDSLNFINQDEIDKHECVCENDSFEITVGLSFYKETKDARWIYVGGYCKKCGLVGNYIDWNER